MVQDNLATLYGAVDDGALAFRGFVRKELEGYLDCGLLCRGFARLRCGGCEETRLVAFSCKGRGFCPSCLGRKMAATAAHLIEDVLPEGVPLRQWVLTVPFAWRKRLGYDGALVSALTRLFVKTVLDFYRQRTEPRAGRGQSGAVVAVQRTRSATRASPGQGAGARLNWLKRYVSPRTTERLRVSYGGGFDQNPPLFCVASDQNPLWL